MSPAAGPSAGGTTLVIAGTGFDGTSRVRFGSTEAPCSRVDSDTQITAVSPAREAGVVDVIVDDAFSDPSPPSDEARFAYAPSARPALAIERVAPFSKGSDTAGDAGLGVVITGRGFCRYGDLVVRFGRLPAPHVDVVSDTQITAAAPAQPGGPVPVSVAAGGSRTASTPAAVFRYEGGLDRPATTAAPIPGVEPGARGQGWATCPAGQARAGCPGGMNTPRYLHATVLLDPPACQGERPPADYPCGQVLVAGGQQSLCVGTCPQPLDSAELYDPGTGSWRRTAPMVVARGEFTATLLPDGRVLAVGGHAEGANKGLGSAELYDPVAETWAPTGALLSARFSHAATLLDGPRCDRKGSPAWCGRVLVSGGTETESGRSPVSSAETYDPGTGRWSRVLDMADARAGHTATLLSDGALLVSGGSQSTGSRSIGMRSSAELFDPDEGMWRPTGAMAVARYAHTATLLADGRVLVVGGIDGASPDNALTYLASAEVYDPATGNWSPAGLPRGERAAHTATLLSDGRVLVAGGGPPFRIGSAAPSLATVEIFEPTTSRWEQVGSLHHARANHGAVRLDGPLCRQSRHPGWCGLPLVVGGESNLDDPGFSAFPPAVLRALEAGRSGRSPPPLATAELWGQRAEVPETADSGGSLLLTAAAVVVLAAIGSAVGWRRTSRRRRSMSMVDGLD
ncbi:MAG: kelch repeat-containing protein [Acidimicrobiales bacterium]